MYAMAVVGISDVLLQVVPQPVLAALPHQRTADEAVS
jgi:hypothetical protein